MLQTYPRVVQIKNQSLTGRKVNVILVDAAALVTKTTNQLFYSTIQATVTLQALRFMIFPGLLIKISDQTVKCQVTLHPDKRNE